MGHLDEKHIARMCAHCMKPYVARAAGHHKYCTRRCFKLVDSKKRRAMYHELIMLGATREQAQQCRYKRRFEEMKQALLSRRQLG